MSTVNLVSCLMNHGKSLAKQLGKAKTIPKLAENNIYDEVEKVINGLINDLNKLDDDEDDDDDKYTTKECFDKVVRKTMSSLEELKKHDDPQYTSGYEVLVTRVELRVVKGFVLPHQLPQPHDPFISNPSQFQHLWKLTLRTRRLSFPTNSDLETLCDLQSLTNLKITWVGACAPDNNQEVQFDVASKFPPKLTKFEMEAASDSTSTKILDLIAQQRNTNVSIPLKKLYIKGGNLSKLNPEVDCKILRLHYLPKIEYDCYDMMKSFPELHRLETSKDVMYSMLRRSFQKATGTNDQNSGWEPSLNTPPTSPSAS